MKHTITLRAFQIDNVREISTWGLVGETEIDNWEYQFDEPPEQFSSALTDYVNHELPPIDSKQPAIQREFDGVAVLLDELVFRVIEDEIEFEFRLSSGGDIQEGTPFCSAWTHVDAGTPAERHFEDERIGAALQRACDGLDHRIDWIEPVSPRELDSIAEQANEFFEEEK